MIDMETRGKKNERPINSSPMGRRGSDTRVPLNTEEDEDINYPWTDCVLNEECDESASINIPNCRKDIQYNYVTICEKENSSVNSGTDGRNSDIGVMADFSDDEEESEVEQFSGCRIPGCQCDGHIEYMEWGSDDMTETDDSEYENPDERANRLYVESYNYDLSEGMTPETYTPPLRKNRRRRYEVRNKKEPEIEESISGTSEWGFQTDKESPNSEPTVRPRTVADEDIPTVRVTGSDKDISSDVGSKLFDRPVTESATAGAGRNSHCPSDVCEKHFGRLVTEKMTAIDGHDVNFSSDDISEMYRQFKEWMRTQAGSNEPPVEQSSCCRIPGCPCEGRIEYMEWGPEDMTETDDSEYEVFDRPVTESVMAWAGSDTDHPGGEDSEFFDRPVTESVTARAADTVQILVMNVSTVTTEQSELSDTDVPSGEDSELIDRPVTELVTAQAGSNTDFPNGEHSEFVDRPVTESVTVQTESNTNFPSEEDSVFFGRPVTEPVTSRAGSDTDLPSNEHSEFFGRPVTDAVTAQAGSYTLSQWGTFRICRPTGHGVGDGTNRK